MTNHSSEMQLYEKIERAKTIVKEKGDYLYCPSQLSLYKVKTIGLDEATDDPVVIYESQYGPNFTWVCPVDVWCHSDIINHSVDLMLAQKKLDFAKTKIKEQRFYSHYRTPSQLYKVKTVGLDKITFEPVVIYKACYGTGLTWVRRLDIWCEQVEYNGELVPRFQLVSDVTDSPNNNLITGLKFIVMIAFYLIMASYISYVLSANRDRDIDF